MYTTQQQAIRTMVLIQEQHMTTIHATELVLFAVQKQKAFHQLNTLFLLDLSIP